MTTTRPLRPANDLTYQIKSGEDPRDWEPEDLVRLMEDLLRARDLLKRAAEELEEDGRMRGKSPTLDAIYAALGE